MTLQTPFTDTVWCFAGCSSDGIIYAASMDPILLDLKLWAYTNIRKKWKLLTTCDRASGSVGQHHHCLISAAYNEKLGRVDVFLEVHEGTAFIFRFMTGPPAKLDSFLVAANYEDIGFDGTTGPVFHYVGDNLIIGGSMRPDHGSVWNLFRVDINYHDDRSSNSFTLPRMWRSTPALFMLQCYDTASVGDNFILRLGNKISIFKLDFDRSLQQWNKSMSIDCPPNDACAIFASQNVNDRIWTIANDPSGVKINEFMVHSIGSDIGQVRSLYLDCHDFSLTGIHFVYSSLKKPLLASSTHVFWTGQSDDANPQDEIGESVLVKSLTPPSLQYSCLCRLFASIPAFEDCETEERAMELGIPPSIWRRYCR